MKLNTLRLYDLADCNTVQIMYKGHEKQLKKSGFTLDKIFKIKVVLINY